MFGETVYFKAHNKHDVAKTLVSFTKGMWLGRDSNSRTSDCDFTLRHQISKHTRVIPSEEWKTNMFDAFTGYALGSEGWRHFGSVVLVHATDG